MDKIAVVGLGYVGLPLAVALAPHKRVVGFDINKDRIQEIKQGHDRTGEVNTLTLASAPLKVTDAVEDLKSCTIFIVTVPTPVDTQNKPDLTILLKASETVGQALTKGAIVVFESTVYPGVTEDMCAPVLEKASGLVCGQDFFLGYSPERINPGDKVHTVNRITKVVSGQTPAVAQKLKSLYGLVNNGNIFIAKDIKTAEAAKVIENAQRDINIAFVNEISMIFSKMGISTHDVLEAAGTKWNFLPFTPGLVGGHCIGVDPFYLAECARTMGHHPEVVLAGRRINDTMGSFIAATVHQQISARLPYGQTGRILILGLTFKENVPDLRNTKVVDIVKSLQEYGHHVDVHDPLADRTEAKEFYGIDLLESLQVIESAQEIDQKIAVGSGSAVAAHTPPGYTCVIGAVPHTAYQELTTSNLAHLTAPHGLIADMKGMWRKVDLPENRQYWSL